MITVFLRGGLGNQMFQYALGLHLAKKNKTELVLDTVHLSDRFPRPNFTYRTFDLDVFAITPRFTLLSRIASKVSIPGVWLGLDMLGIGARPILGFQHFIRERSEAFDPAVLGARGNILLFGRWQSEKYFKEIADDVRTAFRFKYPFQGGAKMLAEKILSPNSVSIHVRRGDYAAFANVKKLMGETNLDYYARAANYVAERVKTPQFFVFSDDVTWCRKYLRLPFRTTYVNDASRGPKASWHMALMTQCKHNIITNSTFSWWAAWLNRNAEKIIVAPRRWYVDDTPDVDIVPERWIRL